MCFPIDTHRLRLRDFLEDDIRAVQDYAGDLEVVRFMDWGPNAWEDSEAFVLRCLGQATLNPRREFKAAVIETATEQLIGTCGLAVTIPALNEAELGYCFNRDSWNRGMATEAAEALITVGFQQLGLHRIFATCDTENGASIRVLEKLGMRREGHLREYRILREQWRDHLLYAVLNREWSTR